MMDDQRSLPRIATTLSWADRQAGTALAKAARPFSVISTSTWPPRPPPVVRTKPSRCKGRRFRKSVVRSIPSQSLNSAMVQLFLACNAPKMGVCVGRMPCRRTSASKNCVIARDVRRTLKHVQFSTDAKSNNRFIVCIYTQVMILSTRLFRRSGLATDQL